MIPGNKTIGREKTGVFGPGCVIAYCYTIYNSEVMIVKSSKLVPSLSRENASEPLLESLGRACAAAYNYTNIPIHPTLLPEIIFHGRTKTRILKSGLRGGSNFPLPPLTSGQTLRICNSSPDRKRDSSSRLVE